MRIVLRFSLQLVVEIYNEIRGTFYLKNDFTEIKKKL